MWNLDDDEIKPMMTSPTKERPIGLAGKEYPDFRVGKAFFKPLPDDIAAVFNGEQDKPI